MVREYMHTFIPRIDHSIYKIGGFSFNESSLISLRDAADDLFTCYKVFDTRLLKSVKLELRGSSSVLRSRPSWPDWAIL